MKNQNSIMAFFLVFCYLVSLTSTQLVSRTSTKYLGNIHDRGMTTGISGVNSQGDFKRYWNRLTVGTLGKWSIVQPTQFFSSSTPGSGATLTGLITTTSSPTVNIPDKLSAIIDPDYDPSWLANLDDAGRLSAVNTWIDTICTHIIISGVNFLDVVNSALTKRPVYADAFGGNGQSGWDWVVNIYRKVKSTCPSTMELHINDQLSDPVL